MESAICWPVEGVSVWVGLWRRLRGWLLWLGGAAQEEPLPRWSDERLLQHFLAHPEDPRRAQVFSTLMGRHKVWLFRMLTGVLGCQADAEDVTQEVMVRAWFALDGSLRDGNLRLWLRVMALRLAFNWKRDGRTRRRYEDAATQELPTSRPPSGARALEAEDAMLVVLRRLAYPYREILSLYYIEEMALAEIAEALDIGLSATKMRLKRARAMFEDAYRREVEP
jgi:RNA polymerase sigma-70 factor (ECF subfamily)